MGLSATATMIGAGAVSAQTASGIPASPGARLPAGLPAGAPAAKVESAQVQSAQVEKAQVGGAPVESAQVESAQPGRATAFSIPPQPLASALTDFGRQSGLQIVVDPPAVAGRPSAGVSGTMTAEQALQRLLAGTGIGYRFTSPRSVSVGGAPDASGAMTLDPVQVQGAFPVPPQGLIDNVPPPYAGGQVGTGSQLGLLGNRDVMDTPFNQTSYTAKKAQDQQAVSVREVLNDDPSIRIGTPAGGPGVDLFNIRGFGTGGTGTTSYGGLFGLLPGASIMPEMAERVEVLKGPSAMLNGMVPQGSIGGVVNVVPKRAPDHDLTQITATYLSGAQFGGHVDVARRFGEDRQFGVRFNGVYRNGATAYDNNTDERGLAILGFDFRGDRFRLSFDLGYQQQYIGGLLSYIGLANGVPLPAAPNARINQGQSWFDQQRRDLFGMVRGELDLTERVTAYVAMGAHDFRFAGLYGLNALVSNAASGNATLSPYTLNRYQTFVTAEAGIRARVETGPVGHELAFVANTYGSDFGTGQMLGTPFATNIYNPATTARQNIGVAAANRTSWAGMSSLGLADTLSAADGRIQLTVGARLQQVRSANFSAVTGQQTSAYDESALSPSVALVFKPLANVSVYGNWIQGLQPGMIVGTGFTNAGEVFPPYKATQYEAGVKVDWGRLTTTLGVFQISQPSVLTNVATNTQFLGGEQVNQGLEFNFFGEVTEGVRVLGGAMFLNAVLAKTQGNLTNGWIAPFSPSAQFNLAGEWDLPFVEGLTLTGRVTYTGEQFIDTTWPRRVLPEWTRFDVGARYAFENPGAKGKLLVARFDVGNVLGTSYWEGGAGATTLFLGAPRTFRLSLTADF